MSTQGGGEVGDIDIAVAHWRTTARGGSVLVAAAIAESLGCETIYTVSTPPEEVRESVPVEFYDVLQDLSYRPVRRAQLVADRAFEYGIWEDVDWDSYGHPDVLITSGSTTRAVVTPDDTLHINYCHSPPRWLYDLYHDRKSSLKGTLARPLLRWLRTRDAAVDNRVDYYFANSPVIQRRLWKYYSRSSEVVYPPLTLDDYRDEPGEGFYLSLGRLDEEKGIEAVVEAFDGLDQQIVFAGSPGDVGGETLERIRSAPNMSYRGYVEEEEKLELLATCRAVVFNGRKEDFGIVPVEAQASATPCLGRNEGFPGMFIEDGQNGYTHDGTAEGIRQAVSRFEADPVTPNPEAVEQFARTTFEDRLTGLVAQYYSKFTDRFRI